MRQQGQQRLRAIKLEKGADTAQGNGGGGLAARLGWLSGCGGGCKNQNTGRTRMTFAA